MITLSEEMYRPVTREDGRTVSYCTDRQIALHVVGLDHRKPYNRHGKLYFKPHRNFFTGKNDFLEKLVSAGLMWCDRDNNDANRVMYGYNRTGLDWLGQQIGVYIYNCE